MVTTATKDVWGQSMQVGGVRALNAALVSINLEIIYAK